MGTKPSVFPVSIPLFIQNTLFGLGQLEVLEGGYNSDVLLFSHSRQVIVKVIGGKKGLGLTLQDATVLGQQVAKYRKLLLEAGVPVPGFLEWAVTQEESSGQVYLFITEPYSGYSTKQFLAGSGHVESVYVTRKVMESIEPLLELGLEGGFLPIGLDPKTTNFVLSHDGDGCTYVDFMPPRYRQSDGTYLVEYPQLQDPKALDLWKWKYFTQEGLVTIALYQLGRLCPSRFQAIKKKACDWLSERGLKRPFLCLDGLNQIDANSVRQQTNPYLLRLLMCELASRPGANVPDSAVEEFFLRTHFEGELPPPVQRWSQNRLATIASIVC